MNPTAFSVSHEVDLKTMLIATGIVLLVGILWAFIYELRHPMVEREKQKDNTEDIEDITRDVFFQHKKRKIL